VEGKDISTEKRVRLNEEIRAKELRLIGDNGDQLGIVSRVEALAKAKETGLDLVEIAPNAQPPVAKIMDHGKYLFQQKKKQTEARKKQVKIHIKELRLRLGIEEGDYQVKLRNLLRFLDHGDKVKVSLRFRGREMSHKELGMELFNHIKLDVEEFADVEMQPKLEGKQITMVLVPKKLKK